MLLKWRMGNGNGNETEKGGMGNGDRWYQFFFD